MNISVTASFIDLVSFIEGRARIYVQINITISIIITICRKMEKKRPVCYILYISCIYYSMVFESIFSIYYKVEMPLAASLA